MIPDEKITEIRHRIDIAELVGEYVGLRRAGANLKGVCPFHADTDPSFNVNVSGQFFHCFGCGASGDVFGFLMRIEGIEFYEAIKRLAGRAGVELPSKPMSSAAITKQAREYQAKQKRQHILEEAASFFETQLSSKDIGAPARQALEERQISSETAKLFRLGYAPDSWSALMDYMRQKRVDARELESVGLVVPRKSGDGFYDRFRNRLMFTITDQWGNPIAFSGRALDPDSSQQGAKYINSPETKEYSKGKVLYGLYQARVPMSKSKEVILVEGNFDVVSLVQAGISNVVAPLGTALTSEQADLLRRRVERAVIMFDGDRAGRVAAARAFPILAEAGIASYTAPLPINEDPDSVIRSGGLQIITELLKKRMGLLDQIISDAASQSDGSVQDMASRIEKMRPFIKAIRVPLEADLYRKKIAQAFHVDLETVFRTLRGGRVQLSRRDQRDERQNVPGSVEERELMVLLLSYPALWEEAQNTGVISLIDTATIKELLEHFGHRKEKGEASVSEIISLASQMNLGAWLSEHVMANPYNSEEKARKALAEIGKKLAILPVKEQIEKIEAEIRLADSAGDDIRVLELSRQKAVLQGAR